MTMRSPGRNAHHNSRPGTPIDSWVADGAAMVITAALAVMLLVDTTGTVRVLLAVSFLCYVPGRALVANWPAAQARSQVALPVVLSISIVTLVSVVGLWVHVWEPIVQFGVMAAASVAAIAVAMLRRRPSGGSNVTHRPVAGGRP
jgi:uncharacterized membrane protein